MSPRAARLWFPLVAAAIAAVLLSALPGLLGILAAAGTLWFVLWMLLPRRSAVARSTAAAARPAPTIPDDAAILQLTAELIEPLPSGVFLLDNDLHVLAMNRAAEELTGRGRAQAVGHSLIRGTFDHELLQVARAGDGQSRLIERPGEREVRVTAQAVRAGPVSLVLVVEDRSALARAVRARTDLIANVSHELRTPVAAAQALAETLRDGVEDPGTRERFAGRLVDETARLGAIVGRLLYLSRIESGVDAPTPASLDPAEVIAAAVAGVAPLAEPRGIRFELRPPPERCSVLADRDRLLEVLENLLDNALRFSPDGGAITIAWSPAPAPSCPTPPAGASPILGLSIRDEGPGILPGERERVFERFFTSDRSRGPGGGTGLGLSISRHLVEAQGGSIWVGDEMPGTTMHLTLPLAPAEDALGLAATDGADAEPPPSR